MEQLLKGSATAMAQAVRAHEVSPVELVEAHIRRAEALDGELNAMVLPRYEEALAEARDAERALGSETGPLHGVPYTAKECIEVAGMPCVDASKLFEGNVSETDARVITSIRQAGGILLGKTNIPEFALHYDSNNLVYGATANPHDTSRSAGGSSGGEGAALAAGFTAFGVGSDYGGSIRIPSAFCGVVGIRPGRWVIPYKGHFPVAHTMSVQLSSEIGPMARYVEDLELLMPVFGKPDLTTDPDVYGADLTPVSAEGLRIAVFEEDGIVPVEEVCREAVRAAGRALADAGHDVAEERPPLQSEVNDLFRQLALSELAALMWPVVQPQEAELSPQIRRIFRQKVDTADMGLASYVWRLAHRVELERAVAAWLEQYPIAICPVTPTPAFPIGTEVLDIEGQEVEEVDMMSLCTYVNLLGLPAAAVPVKRSPEGLPVGVQVIGRRGHEMQVLAVAKELESAFGGWLDPEAVKQDVA